MSSSIWGADKYWPLGRLEDSYGEWWNEKTWLRADAGGIVEMHHERGDLVHEGDPMSRLTNQFTSDATVVEAA